MLIYGNLVADNNYEIKNERTRLLKGNLKPNYNLI